eukprot:CAMPEP_0118719962 /NCGR_PEP_ID=MMETSP0800-20121206/29826_1 /TAXON_ID=210618 ORGANISM="Striatella unipunctata, Strain CCMP2910" /NCGR_SAMPLE_ID=MMETSP0800 /ASSEMBLY_ACC=CAM_ASM_000638 /LENGTH=30 /DNA_ID= /DNA_START= /DNA_END= /DNA_ORIENTATION=
MDTFNELSQQAEHLAISSDNMETPCIIASL